ncbi:LPXTG cell wall anchor domain-containing protein [Lacticaseibacillus suilingensis]|uniref:LPXTG cell wall anchor domain-containing protein n=1 Tax=Lacticaseibacillus suilingensis TaxID=2799577 RepID=A0ABW4BL77_9LACO|nr:LPXTG cell wall anchor domain-containing protein [Lacticaseibacillus suilingensis]
MQYWDQWFGYGGYGINENSEIIPGNKIWPKSEESKAVWPKGSDKASLNRYINRTIEYRDQDTNEIVAPTVKQQVHYGETMIIDLVTGENLGYAPEGGKKPTTRLKAEGWYGMGDTTFSEVVSPNLSAQGYDQPTLASVPALATSATSSDSKVVVYYPHHITENKEIKKVNETIHYVFKNGNKAANDYKASILFTRIVKTDDVTKKTTYSKWDPANAQSFVKVDSPVISGYKADQRQVDAVNGVTATSSDIVKIVVYSSLKNPIKDKDSNTPAKIKGTKSKTLPQTGEKSQGALSLIGLLLITTFGYSLKKLRKKTDAN